MKKIFLYVSLILCNIQFIIAQDSIYVSQYDSLLMPETYSKYKICRQIFDDIVNKIDETHKKPPYFRILKMGKSHLRPLAEYDGIDTITIREELVEFLMGDENFEYSMGYLGNHSSPYLTISGIRRVSILYNLYCAIYNSYVHFLPGNGQEVIANNLNEVASIDDSLTTFYEIAKQDFTFNMDCLLPDSCEYYNFMKEDTINQLINVAIRSIHSFWHSSQWSYGYNYQTNKDNVFSKQLFS